MSRAAPDSPRLISRPVRILRPGHDVFTEPQGSITARSIGRGVSPTPAALAAHPKPLADVTLAPVVHTKDDRQAQSLDPGPAALVTQTGISGTDPTFARRKSTVPTESLAPTGWMNSTTIVGGGSASCGRTMPWDRC